MGLDDGMRYDQDGISLGLRLHLIEYLYVRLKSSSSKTLCIW